MIKILGFGVFDCNDYDDGRFRAWIDVAVRNVTFDKKVSIYLKDYRHYPPQQEYVYNAYFKENLNNGYERWGYNTDPYRMLYIDKWEEISFKVHYITKGDHDGLIEENIDDNKGDWYTLVTKQDLSFCYKKYFDGNKSNNYFTLLGAQRKILVVDDEPCIQGLYKEELESRGYIVYTANDGIEALRILEEHTILYEPFDLVLLDIKMPGIDGFTVARKIKDMKCDMPIFIVSAYEDYRHDFGTWATDAYIVKSANLAELLMSISQCLFN